VLKDNSGNCWSIFTGYTSFRISNQHCKSSKGKNKKKKKNNQNKKKQINHLNAQLQNTVNITLHYIRVTWEWPK